MDRPIGKRARWIVASCAGGLSVLAGLTGIAEFDQWFHMAWGRAFLREGFRAREFFVFTLRDQPAGVPYEWLGSIGVYASWLLGGETGTVVVVGIMVGLTIGIAVWDGLDGDDATWADAAIALLVAALAVGVVRQRAVARPEIFCLPLLAWTLVAARRWLEGRGRAILAFPAVALLWANVHPTVLYGLGAVLALAAEGVVRSGAAGRRRALTLAGVGVAGLALSFVQPGGSPVMVGVQYGLGLLGVHGGLDLGAATENALALAQGAILELQPPPLEFYLSSLGVMILAAATGFAVAWRRVRLAELALAAIALYLGARAIRFMPMFAVVAAAPSARNLRAGAALVRGRWRRALWVVPGLVPAAAASSLLLLPVPFSLGRSAEIFPTKAAEVLRAAGAHEIPGLRVYDTFQFGGFLEWYLDAPVLYDDGRLWWPPGEAEVAMRAAGARDVAWLDARWRFDALVLDTLRYDDQRTRLSDQAVMYDPMADRDTFALVAIDDGAFLYVRRDGKLSKLLASEYRVASPSRVLSVAELDDASFVRSYREEMARAVAENPSCLCCRAGLYLGYLAAGDADAAERLFPGGAIPASQHPFGNGALQALESSMANLWRARTLAAAERVRDGDREAAARLLRIARLAAPPR